MNNTITYADKLTEELDKLFVQSTVTGFLTDTALRAKFVGAHTVLIPDMELSGLGDYDREGGFAEGSVTVSHTPFTLTQDRGRSFMLDAQDEDEAGAANLAGQVLGEFVRTKVVPEVDAYCLSRLATLAVENGQTETLAEGETLTENVLALLRRLIGRVRETVGYDEPLVAFCDPAVYDALTATPEIARYLRQDDFTKGDLHLQVNHIDNVAILPVPSERMKTAYDFRDGITDGETDGGFAAAAGAQSIGLLVMPKRGASLIRKTEKLRTFTPDQNQKADAYKFDYRLYYDLLVRKSQQPVIFAYTHPAE